MLYQGATSCSSHCLKSWRAEAGQVRSGQVRSGQVRSGQRAHSEQAVVAHACSSVQGRNKKRGEGVRRGTACTGVYKEVRAVQTGSVAGRGV